MYSHRTPEFAIRVQFQNVWQSFRVIRERPDTLREVFTRVLRHASRFQGFDALKNVSFEIGEGEAVGIVGRNGSGKSTTLKIIAGVYRPSKGRVAVRGRVAALIELSAGFQPEMTGRENIVINGLILGLSRRQIKEREDAIVEFAELGDFIDSPIKQYSTGMVMRLAFAIAAEVDPDILLIDEILAVGDAAFQRKCITRIEEFRTRGKTLIFVSHAIQSVIQLCPRALLLHKGELLADGPVREIAERYDELTRQPVAAR
jgi:ABC-type polysaccharide/polyol phosphate transport system ATPase subunit